MAIARSRRTGEEEGDGDREVMDCGGCCKVFLKFCLSHVGLCMIVCLYSVAGWYCIVSIYGIPGPCPSGGALVSEVRSKSHTLIKFVTIHQMVKLGL